jgi:Fic family protein
VRTFRAGTLVDQGGYRSFQPSHIHRVWVLDDMRVQGLLSHADRQLGRLDMYSQYVPNIELFIRMHVVKEATQSSRIEGTRTRVDEALLDRKDVPSEKRQDWEEVQNYIEAMGHAAGSLERLPLSSRLIREAHQVLMRGVRGEHKRPGKFRTSQNWIGGAGPEMATFVPPVHGTVPELMADLERFVHDDEIYLPDLLRIALVHYQFETIHPFLDGNGRVGRLLIPLYLLERKILKRPILYLSDYLERNRAAYYDTLTRVREADDLSTWFRFFLTGIIVAAESGIATFDGILQLQKEMDERVRTLGHRAGNASRVIHALYRRPLIDARRVSEVTELSMPSSYRLIADLERLEILREITGARRGRLYQFDRYLDLFR